MHASCSNPPGLTAQKMDGPKAQGRLLCRIWRHDGHGRYSLTNSNDLRGRASNKGAVTATVSNPAAVIAHSIAAASAGMLPTNFAHGLEDLGARDGRAAGWITGLSLEDSKIIADVE